MEEPKVKIDWDIIDEAASAEGWALKRGFRSTRGIARKSQEGGVFRTTRGSGVGAAAKPASGGFEKHITR